MKMRLINDIRMLRISPEDSGDSRKSFKQGEHIGSLESSLGQQHERGLGGGLRKPVRLVFSAKPTVLLKQRRASSSLPEGDKPQSPISEIQGQETGHKEQIRGLHLLLAQRAVPLQNGMFRPCVMM